NRDAYPVVNYPASLSSPGTAWSTDAFALFASMSWWQLHPSGTGNGKAGTNLITSGGGTWGQGNYVTSAITSSKDWMLAYVPVGFSGTRSITVNMAAMAGPSRARWFDPTTGTYVAIDSGWTSPNSGTRTFVTPGFHNDSTDDWVLVIDTGTTP